MKVKIYEVQQFNGIYDKIKDITLPIKLGYRLAKLAAQCQKEIDIYQSQLQKLIQEYGARDEKNELVPTEDGQGIKIKEDKIQECQEKINELISLDVEISGDLIPISLFENDIKLSIDEIKILSPFLSEE